MIPPLAHRGSRLVASVVVVVAMTLLASAAAFGASSPDTRYLGSASNLGLKQPTVGMAATPTGRGYWLVAGDGGIFTFGNARFRGAGTTPAYPTRIVGIASTPSGNGYWIASADGGTLAFGDARPFGTQMAPPGSDVVAIAASPRSGYWVATRDGTVGTSSGSSAIGPRAIALELMRRMNDERAARHLRPLAWDPLLAGYANSWANTLLMTKQYRHQDLGAILVAANGRLAEAGENI